MDISTLETKISGQVAGMLYENTDSIYQAIAEHTVDNEIALQAKMTTLVKETFDMIKTVISFAAQKQTIAKFLMISLEHNKLTDERLTACSVYDSLAQVLLTEIIFTAAMCYGMLRFGHDNPGRLAALAINMLYMCVTSISIGWHLNQIRVAKNNSALMQDILKEEMAIEVEDVDLTKNKKNKTFSDLVYPIQKTVVMPVPESGDIVLEDIYFAYPSRPSVFVINGISLNIKSGQKVGIAGESGSGKSTLTALLLRFYDLNSGSICFNEVPIKKMNPNVLRSKISLVSQQPMLFDQSVNFNIKLGKLNATQAEINLAAKKADAWEFISSLPDGFQTRCGENGQALSTSQKYKLMLAIALIGKPQVLILDEMTASMDSQTEEQIQKSIDIASDGITTITISHRLKSLLKSDRIIVMHEGKIIEQGTPVELMANKESAFFKMYSEQKVEELDINIPVSPITSSASVKYLTHKYSMGNEEIKGIDEWARQSLCRKRLGRSYSVMNTESEKTVLPTMSFKRNKYSSRSFKANIVDIPVVEAAEIVPIEEFELPGKRNNLNAIMKLIRSYKEGLIYILCSVPLMIVRGSFWLLICFEIPAVLEVVLAPKDEISQKIFNVGAMYVALIIIKTIFEALGRLFVSKYSHGFCSHLRINMFKQLLRHGAAYFEDEKNTPGRLVYKVMNNSALLNKVLSDKIDLLVPAIICFAISATVSLLINWKLALLCSFQFPAFFIFRLIELQEANKRQKQILEEDKKAGALASMVLSNICTIKVYNLQEHFIEMFNDTLKPLEKAMRIQAIIGAFVYACQFSFSYLMITITLKFGKDMMLSNEIDPLNYLRVVLLTQFGANCMSQLITSVTDIAKARVASEQILKVLREPVECDHLSDEGLRPKIAGRVTLSQLEFRYPSRPIIPVLKDINLKVSKGHFVAIIGPSEDEYTMDKIIDAAKTANIHNFIISLPNGYDTEIGEHVNFSAGQAMRISIARAIIRNPKILLLDEPFASLDSKNEKTVQKALEQASKSITCILISHRLASIRNADKIVVLVNGTIIAKGSHEELIAENGLYSEMNKLQKMD
uniref:ABC transporter domain-containing protein n=1 Tax=Rhabditophanes sp. KR3021 TaxID=114890 RepID=A0AC35UF18_9BILA